MAESQVRSGLLQSTKAHSNLLTVCLPKIAMTGHITEGSHGKIVQRLNATRRLAFGPTSVFIDIGSGMGRAALHWASASPRAALGFDICPSVIHASTAAVEKVQHKLPGRLAPIAVFQADARDLQSITPATHVFAFEGDKFLLEESARLAAGTTTCKVLILVRACRDTSSLLECGLIDTDNSLRLDGEDVITISGK